MLAMRSDSRHGCRLENRYRQQAGSYRDPCFTVKYRQARAPIRSGVRPNRHFYSAGNLRKPTARRFQLLMVLIAKVKSTISFGLNSALSNA